MQATPTTLSFAGIDWSWQHHALCIVDRDGQRIEEATMPHSRPGLAKITTVLRRHGVERVGIERGDGPVVEHLLRDGFQVVVISARQVKSLRARYGSAGNKDDRFDAFVLADALRTDARRWAVVQPDREDTIALRMLVRTRHDLPERSRHRTRQRSSSRSRRSHRADPPRPAHHAAATAGTARGSDQGSPARPPRRADLPVPAPCRRCPRNAWARDTYDRARARGCRHPHAARILAQGWTRILWRCWHDQVPYNPDLHGRLSTLLQDAA